MSYLTSGFAEVIYKSSLSSGYREQQTALAFSIAGFDPVDGPHDIFDLWQDFIVGLGWPSTAYATGVQVRVGTADPSGPLVYEWVVPEAGSGSNDTLTPQCSILATKRTNLGGRVGRGRMYLGAPLEDYVDNTGTIDGTYLGNVQTALDTLVAGTETIIGGDAYLLHATASPAPTLITSITCQPILATQRRRLARN